MRCARWSRRSSRTPTSMAPARMVKPPVVQCAGMLRAVGRGVDTPRLGVAVRGAGQYLFMPPNVSGWDDTRWLDTATFRARWQMAQYICNPARLDPDERHRSRRPGGTRRAAAAFLGARRSAGRSVPASSATPPTRSPPPTRAGSGTTYPVLALNALRMLVATSPDYLTS